MHHQHLGGQLAALHHVGQEPDGVVDLSRVHGSNFPAGPGPVLHGKLGIQRQVHIRPLEEMCQPRQFRLHCAESHLHVHEEEPPPLLGPLCHPLDNAVGHPQPVHAVPAAVGLRHRDDHVESRPHRYRGIRLGPFGDRLLQPPEHLVPGVLAQHAHPARQRIAVVRHHPAGRHYGPRQHLRQRRPRYRISRATGTRCSARCSRGPRCPE